MTFADIALDDYFMQDGIRYQKLSEATAYTSGVASGPNWHWRKSGRYTFEADDTVEEFSRWRMP